MKSFLLSKTEPKKLTPQLMRELTSIGNIINVRVEQSEKGLVIAFNVAGNASDKLVLGQARKGIRYFQSFDGAASVLQGMGITEFIACTDNWMPRTKVAKGQEQL